MAIRLEDAFHGRARHQKRFQDAVIHYG
jgi:hypothetical protein